MELLSAQMWVKLQFISLLHSSDCFILEKEGHEKKEQYTFL